MNKNFHQRMLQQAQQIAQLQQQVAMNNPQKRIRRNLDASSKEKDPSVKSTYGKKRNTVTQDSFYAQINQASLSPQKVNVKSFAKQKDKANDLGLTRNSSHYLTSSGVSAYKQVGLKQTSSLQNIYGAKTNYSLKHSQSANSNMQQ